jgi:hypothetical protein
MHGLSLLTDVRHVSLPRGIGPITEDLRSNHHITANHCGLKSQHFIYSQSH